MTKTPPKPRRSAGLILRGVYQKKADLEKERLGMFALAQQKKRELNRNEKNRENKILSELLRLAVSEVHLRKDQDWERTTPGIKESEPDIDPIVEQYKQTLDPAGDATRASTPGYDERLKLFSTTKMERERRVNRETAETKEKVRRVLQKIAQASADDDVLDFAAEKIAWAIVNARNFDSWARSPLLKTFHGHVNEAKRSLAKSEKWLRRIDIDLREMAASDRPGELQNLVNGQLLDGQWEPGPLIGNSIADYLSLSIANALQSNRGASIDLLIPGISAPRGAPRDNSRLALFLITAYIFHKLTGQQPALIGVNFQDGHPTGKGWDLCEQIWKIGWPGEAAKPPEKVIKYAFKTYRDECIRKPRS